ncbi:putative glycosyl transferase, group 1 domain containing protein [Neospora caninum Liverpool]|uniref:Alpha-1,3/1,6-mannosyltransferase ALG2 n=1 Tax=Neospora caninum (strain Liverpool) TaxID=572307 RepID=F0VLK0_NEOCL|nr:putative glycosyl transferase, group 1 domain containing protein [Neospora caninum Liverpool]CBZ54128.1 putative glycosyl transferase, group 1 domain containing protein [Neospora caninum Liverpool]|eukprot:XP_003884159.1 putative glycosyl transferase, group 1 domain containing protein [Neospora caninum Liverpool]
MQGERKSEAKLEEQSSEGGNREGSGDDGFDVEILTTNHDRSRCFPATVDGRLKVSVYGRFLPRSIFGKAVALCSLLRMFWLVLVIFVTGLWLSAICLSLSSVVEGRWRRKVIFNDQVAAVNPLLSLFCEKLVFYAHFPDLHLVQRDAESTRLLACLKKWYRAVLDAAEAATTGQCGLLLFNSRFTEQTYRRTFPLMRFPRHKVLYPPVDTDAADAFRRRFCRAACVASLKALPEFKDFDFSVPFVFSLNRYEKKKDLQLAIHAVARAQSGFNSRLPENALVFEELLRTALMQSGFDVLWPAAPSAQSPASKLAKAKRTQVVFVKNIDEAARQCLMAVALCLVYTPFEEHPPLPVGPVRGERARLSGRCLQFGRSPRECPSRENGKWIKTGFLCEHDARSFGDAILRLAVMQREDPPMYEEMRQNGCRHVKENFSYGQCLTGLSSPFWST